MSPLAMPKDDAPFGDWAAWYALALKWPVFPLKPGGKDPLPGSHGFKDATTDLAQIASWWAAMPGANIGVPTGLPETFSALDVDKKEWAEKRGDITIQLLCDLNGPLPETVRQQTWSGGYQDMFVPVGGLKNSAGEIGSGIDIRGEGGYVVVAPSRVTENGRSGEYSWVHAPGDIPMAWMPSWLIEKARQPTKPAGTPVAGEVIPEGKRNDTLYRAGRSLATRVRDINLVTGALLEMNRTSCVPPLSEAEVRAIAKHCIEEGHRSDFKGLGGVRSMSTEKGQPGHAEILVVGMDEVQAEEIQWVWPGRLAVGKVSLSTGVPDVGKSVTALDEVARLSSGRGFPMGYPGTEPVVSLIFASEDDPADTIKPRLIAAGADLTRVKFAPAVQDENGKRGFRLDRDMPLLRLLVQQFNAKHIVIDPLMSFTGDLKTGIDAEMRKALDPLTQLARDFGLSMRVLVHLNKSEGQSAMSRVTGSGATVAASRVGHVSAPDPKDPTRYLHVGLKNNLSREKFNLAYRLRPFCWRCRMVTEADKDNCPTCNAPTVPRVEWEEIGYSITADALLAPKPPERAGGAQSEAEALLNSLIPADGKRVDAKTVENAAKVNQIPWWAVKKARKALGIEAIPKVGLNPFDKQWDYCRPAPGGPEDAAGNRFGSTSRF